MPVKDKFDKPSLGDKVILGILRRLKGQRKPKRPSHGYRSGGNRRETDKIFKQFETTRSKDISSQLKNAGIDQKTIDRMRGRK